MLRDDRREDTQAIYRQAGFTGSLGLGERPAVLVVDFQLGFTDPSRSPLAGDFSAEVERAARIVRAARNQGIPVFFTTVGYEPHYRDAGLWIKKVPSLSVLRLDGELTRIDPRLGACEQDTIIVKKYASAFFGTALAATLTAAGVDTLIVTGATTSGCVRASVVDALQYGFRPIVVEDAVADRARGPHEANLFDMKSKYADLMTTDEVLAHLESRKARVQMSV